MIHSLFKSRFSFYTFKQNIISKFADKLDDKSTQMQIDYKLINQPKMETLKILEIIRNRTLSCQEVKSFTKTVDSILTKFDNKGIQQYAHSIHAGLIMKELQRLDIPNLNDLTKKLPELDQIMALSVIREKHFSLLFVLVPKGMQFNWHDHPKMVGNTRCLMGNIKITSLDPGYLVEDPNRPGFFNYLKQHLRCEILTPQNKKISMITPDSYNFHKIEALTQSCFFDLLIPDYPDNKCDFFDTIKQEQDYIVLERIYQPQQNIKDINLILHGKPVKSYSSLLQMQMQQE